MGGKRMKTVFSSTGGFTLIELVLIIVLLSILSSVATMKYLDLREEARESVQKATNAALRTTMQNLNIRQILTGEKFTAEDIIEHTLITGGTLTVEDIPQ